jgi:hypothetical protein
MNLGVINIVTRKGKVGKNGKTQVRGYKREVGANGSIVSWKGLSINMNAGLGFNNLKVIVTPKGEYHPDSINHFNTQSKLQ